MTISPVISTTSTVRGWHDHVPTAKGAAGPLMAPDISGGSLLDVNSFMQARELVPRSRGDVAASRGHKTPAHITTMRNILSEKHARLVKRGDRAGAKRVWLQLHELTNAELRGG